MKIGKKELQVEWNNFFSNEKLPISEQNLWKDNLTLVEAEKVVDNWFQSLSVPEITNLSGKFADYTDSVYNYTTKNVDLTVHNKLSLNQAHSIICEFNAIQDLELINEWTDERIKDEYEESKVPESLNYQSVIELRDKRKEEINMLIEEPVK